MFSHSLEVERFNKHYVSALCKEFSADRNSLMYTFLFTQHQAAALAKFGSWDDLVVRDCTIVKQRFSLTQLRLQPTQPTQAIDAPLEGVQELNFNYMMLVRHYAVASPKEAMLRAGVTYDAATLLRNFSTYDISALARQFIGPMMSCHLSAKAITTVLSQPRGVLAEFIAMFSMRDCLCNTR